jgi:hypothetical protein
MNLEFFFRGKAFLCEAIIDNTDHPCYIFTIHKDPVIVNEFGEEISVKTDCNRVLPKEDDYPQLVELRMAIFNAATQTEEFQSMTSTITRKLLF